MPAMRLLFPGSFDPPHLGHVELIRRAAALADELLVAIAVNPAKQPFLPIERRLALLREVLAGIPRVDVVSYEGQTAAFARARGCAGLVRGIRDGADLGYEHGIATVNREAGGVDTLFLLPAPAVSHLSSALVRTAAAAGMPIGGLVPPAVAAALRAGPG